MCEVPFQNEGASPEEAQDNEDDDAGDCQTDPETDTGPEYSPPFRLLGDTPGVGPTVPPIRGIWYDTNDPRNSDQNIIQATGATTQPYKSLTPPYQLILPVVLSAVTPSQGPGVPPATSYVPPTQGPGVPPRLMSRQPHPRRVQALPLRRRPLPKTPECRLLMQTMTACRRSWCPLLGCRGHARGDTNTHRRCRLGSEYLRCKFFPHTISLLTFISGTYALAIGVDYTLRAPSVTLISTGTISTTLARCTSRYRLPFFFISMRACFRRLVQRYSYEFKCDNLSCIYVWFLAVAFIAWERLDWALVLGMNAVISWALRLAMLIL